MTTVTKCFNSATKSHEEVSLEIVKIELDTESKRANTEFKGYGADYYSDFIEKGFLMISSDVSYHIN